MSDFVSNWWWDEQWRKVGGDRMRKRTPSEFWMAALTHHGVPVQEVRLDKDMGDGSTVSALLMSVGNRRVLGPKKIDMWKFYHLPMERAMIEAVRETLNNLVQEYKSQL